MATDREKTNKKLKLEVIAAVSAVYTRFFVAEYVGYFDPDVQYEGTGISFSRMYSLSR